MNKNKYKFLLFTILIFQQTVFAEIHFGIMGSVLSHSKKLKQKLDDEIFYPDTDSPPTLTIKWWSTVNSTNTTDATKYPVPLDDVLDGGISTFGTRKGGNPGYSDQMTLWVASSSWKTIYALTDGVVVCLHKGYDQDHQVIKYGRNWAIEYCHFAEIHTDLYVGKIVKKGDPIGRIVPMNPNSAGDIPPKTGYFEYRLLRKNDKGNWIAVNPYNYLDDVSKENIKQLWLRKRNKTWGDTDYFGNLITDDNVHNMNLEEIDLGDTYNYNSRIIYNYWSGFDYQSEYYEPPPEE
ncbi:MAG: hypothetical protein SNJ64_03030 [Endomicrobiia bacterium]